MSLKKLPKTWDFIVIGGGITGAGILREGVRMGLKGILIEQKDFAWGTSSRSSKLVHGGLRYIKEGHFLMTKIAVEERDRLLAEAPGLVEPLGFLLPVYEEQSPGKKILKVGLTIYDIMARERQHKFLKTDEFLEKLPSINPEGLKGGFHYFDAQVDDSRLVLRLINESVASGAYALNYTAVKSIIRTDERNVVGVEVQDVETGESGSLFSDAVVNATGCWAEKLHPSPEPQRHLRPLRGSHLVFPSDALSLQEGFSFIHPRDGRAAFVVPWEGAVLVGTTDIDHTENLAVVPNITEDEVTYLMEGIQAIFPSLNITLNDCISAFAGIRPVLSEGKLKPSEESREHVVWVDQGLITVTGGKLTTFRRLAWDALKAAKQYLPPDREANRKDPAFAAVPQIPASDYGLSLQTWRRLYGRYGKSAEAIVRNADREDLTIIPGTHTLWAELPHVAKNEKIRHLGDLLLRRVRIGLLTPEGGKEYLKRVQQLCNDVLPWDRQRWKEEINMYIELWNHAYNLPVRRSEFLAKRKIISFRALKAALSRIYYKVRPAKKHRQAA
ncbi:Aerobic glycerol-3-phosphate dehydrogenase (EC [Olavius sp. associated proteobacterium Delta 1]|nr:Aerobic glycerol-3-phosphate dehydrogenase (EC [Olavius sp. associated proteobacterium Delta 1]